MANLPMTLLLQAQLLLNDADEANHSGDFATFALQCQAREVLTEAIDRLTAEGEAPLVAATEPATHEAKSISNRVHDVRTGLFESTAIVDIARRAISSDDDWYLRHALERVVAQLDGACTDLELIALDVRQLQGVPHG